MKKVMAFLWFVFVRHPVIFVLVFGAIIVLSWIAFDPLNKIIGLLPVVIELLIFPATMYGSLWEDREYRLVIFRAQEFLEQNIFYEKYLLSEIQRAKITRNSKDLWRVLSQCIELEKKLTHLADVQQKAMNMADERERVRDEIKYLKRSLGVEM